MISADMLIKDASMNESTVSGEVIPTVLLNWIIPFEPEFNDKENAPSSVELKVILLPAVNKPELDIMLFPSKLTGREKFRGFAPESVMSSNISINEAPWNCNRVKGVDPT